MKGKEQTKGIWNWKGLTVWGKPHFGGICDYKYWHVPVLNLITLWPTTSMIIQIHEKFWTQARASSGHINWWAAINSVQTRWVLVLQVQNKTFVRSTRNASPTNNKAGMVREYWQRIPIILLLFLTKNEKVIVVLFLFQMAFTILSSFIM